MIKEAQAAYAEGVFSALSQMNLDEEVKIAAVQHLEKVAAPTTMTNEDTIAAAGLGPGFLSQMGSGISGGFDKTVDYLGRAGSALMDSEAELTGGQIGALLGAGGLGAAGLYGAYKGLTSDPVVGAVTGAKDHLVNGVSKLRSGGSVGDLTGKEQAALAAAGVLGAGAVGGLGYMGYQALQGDEPKPDNKAIRQLALEKLRGFDMNSDMGDKIPEELANQLRRTGGIPSNFLGGLKGD